MLEVKRDEHIQGLPVELKGHVDSILAIQERDYIAPNKPDDGLHVARTKIAVPHHVRQMLTYAEVLLRQAEREAKAYGRQLRKYAHDCVKDVHNLDGSPFFVDDKWHLCTLRNHNDVFSNVLQAAE